MELRFFINIVVLSAIMLILNDVFFFCACAEVCAGSFVWRYRRNLPFKISYSCIGIKLCDSKTPVKYVFLTIVFSDSFVAKTKTKFDRIKTTVPFFIM